MKPKHFSGCILVKVYFERERVRGASFVHAFLNVKFLVDYRTDFLTQLNFV